jgi:hypothetical protein
MQSHYNFTMARLDPATQRVRVNGRKGIHAEPRRTRRSKRTPRTPRLRVTLSGFILLANARDLGGRVKPGHGEWGKTWN